MNRIMFFDLETTGLDHVNCAIIQLAAIMVEMTDSNNMIELDRIQLYMKPLQEKRIEQKALDVNRDQQKQIVFFSRST